MSNKRLTAVWEHSEQEKTALLALLSLADRADDDGFCWPSHEDTAQRARTSRTYVGDLLRKIEECGELYIHERPGKTHQYLVLPGMSYPEIVQAMQHRFDYDKLKAETETENIAKKQGVKSTDMLNLQNRWVSVQQTGGVKSTEHEPSFNPKDNPHNSEIDFSSFTDDDWTAFLKAGAHDYDKHPVGSSKNKKQLADYPPQHRDLLYPFCQYFRFPFPDEKKKWIKQVDVWVNRNYTPSDVANAIAYVEEQEGWEVYQPSSITKSFGKEQTSTAKPKATEVHR